MPKCSSEVQIASLPCALNEGVELPNRVLALWLLNLVFQLVRSLEHFSGQPACSANSTGILTLRGV